MSIYIRVFRQDEWQVLRDIRLRAITAHTGYFFADPEVTRNQPDDYWLETLDGKGKQVFGLFDGDKIIGLCAVFTWREDPTGRTGVMAMDYIDPDYRRRGYTELMYSARIDFAIGHEAWDKLSIGHREGNEPSRRAIIKHGFVLIETKNVDWPEGERDVEYVYELDLIAFRAQ